VAVAAVGVVASANVAHLFLEYLSHRDRDTTALVATEMGRYLDTHPEVTDVVFCGGAAMDWGSNPSIQFRHPGMTAVSVSPEVEPSDLTITPTTAVLTGSDCRRLTDALLANSTLEASQLLFRDVRSNREAARMYAETGGRGYLRWVAPSAPVDEQERPILTAFRRGG
jgi:hypothetical protein